MKPKKDPIKPSKTLNKKFNFKEQRLVWVEETPIICFEHLVPSITENLYSNTISRQIPLPRGRLYPLTAQGGLQAHETQSFMGTHKKKTRWGRLKEYIPNIYMKWKHVA